jgi:hypothetical protein
MASTSGPVVLRLLAAAPVEFVAISRLALSTMLHP